MEAQKIVVEVAGDEIEKVDLIADLETRARIFDLAEGEASSSQTCLGIKAGRFCSRISKPGQGSAGGRMRAGMRGVTIKHQTGSRAREVAAAAMNWLGLQVARTGKTLASRNKTLTERHVYRDVATSHCPPREGGQAISLRSGYRRSRQGF